MKRGPSAALGGGKYCARAAQIDSDELTAATWRSTTGTFSGGEFCACAVPIEINGTRNLNQMGRSLNIRLRSPVLLRHSAGILDAQMLTALNCFVPRPARLTFPKTHSSRRHDFRRSITAISLPGQNTSEVLQKGHVCYRSVVSTHDLEAPQERRSSQAFHSKMLGSIFQSGIPYFAGQAPGLSFALKYTTVRSRGKY